MDNIRRIISGLTRDGTAEPSREAKFSGANGDRESIFFRLRLTTKQEEDNNCNRCDTRRRDTPYRRLSILWYRL